MSVAEADPFLDLLPPDDLIGGMGDAPAYQTTGGEFREVPRATLNALPAPETDPFGDLASNAPEDDSLLDVGDFHDLLPQPPKPETRTEQALLETPVVNPRNEEIKAAPTFFGELQSGRIGSAYYLAKKFLGEQFEGQPIEPGRGKGLLGTEERLEDFTPPGMDPFQAKFARAFINVTNRTMAGLTTPEMLPLAVVGGGGGTVGRLVAGAFGADMASHAPDVWRQIQETDKTEPWSQERLETGLDTVLQTAMFGAAARHAVTPAKAPVRPASESGALPATTERAVPETPQGAEPAARAAEASTVPVKATGQKVIHEETGLPLNEDGTVTLYHGTTALGAESIRKTNQLRSAGESSVYLTTEPGGTGYGDGTVVAVRVRPEKLLLDDEFPNGRKDFSVEGASVPIQLEPIGVEAAIAEIQRRNTPSTEPVIPKEPAETKFAEPEPVANAKAAELVPENLRRNPEIDRLINEPEAQVGGQMKFEPATEGGAFGFGGGKRTTVTPKGTTPRGDTEFLRIEPPLKRAFKGLERKGAADVIGETRNKVGKLLAEATTKHVDTEQELFGQISTELIRPIKAVSKATSEKAFDEAAVYFAAKENGRPLPALSPAAKGLVNGWENIAERTGQIAAANGVQVFDPATNTHRPMHVIGRQYVPRMFKAPVERVMRDPNSNPRLWNDLVDELALHRGITDVEAANQLRAEAGRFSSNDFMGNLEMARTGKMPESFYEYDLRNLAAKYIPNFSERMSQIIAYGQRLGPRENPQRPNLWDIARKEAGDSYTQDWLNNAENQAVNLRQKGTAATGMARAQTAASGLLLSSPTTTVMRNLLSGTSATPELLGARRSIKGFADTIKSSQARMDAREIGTVRDNIADFLHADRLGDSPVDNAIRSVVDAGLKYSGYNGSEVFVRTHGTATASQFAKDAVAAINKNPTSMRSKEALGLFKRVGVSPEKIVAENADWKAGPETRKFIRTFVRDTQGGYRFDQVPLWANSNMGRFFYQFGRWGTQRARNIWKNGVQPALGEEVQWHGKTMTRRDIRPLVKMLGTTVVLGETFAGIAQLLFGRDRRDASLSEIAEAWKEDEKTAVGLAFERVINDVIMAGTLGIWSQPIDWAKGLKNQSRLKNPTEPPGLGSINSVMELGQAMLDQDGQVTKRDLLKFASSFAPGAKQVTDVARNVMDEPLYEAENDVRTLRNAAHRWAESVGMDVSPKAKGNFRKSAMAPDYEPIKEALLVGDSERAKFLANSFLDQQPNRSQALKNLRSSIRNSQPFRAGPYTAKVHRDNFREWARKNLSEQDWQQAERIQARYQKSAVASLLW